MILMSIRTYSELIRFSTFEERFRYLKLDGIVGEDTFGFDRYLNQAFYQSKTWKQIRDKVIVRDLGCDLGIEEREILGRILIHHMNPITKEDILNRTELLMNPEFLICTTKRTHDAIHYGDMNLLTTGPVMRTSHDTCPWKRK